MSSLGDVFGVFARGGFRSVFARRGSWCLRSAREGAEKSSARESVSSLGEGVGVFAREGGSRSSLGEGKVFGEVFAGGFPSLAPFCLFEEQN